MGGALAIPTNLVAAAQAGGLSQPLANLDTNLATIATYVNAREVVFDVIANRPAAGTAGRWFFATDSATLYADNGVSWQTMSAAFPVGAILDYAGAAAPTGWLLCDGSAVSRTGGNAALFAVCGTTWGVGDGSTTFNVPDFRSRAVVGAGQGSGLTNRVRGATGGEETHVLSTAELASHSHGAGSFAVAVAPVAIDGQGLGSPQTGASSGATGVTGTSSAAGSGTGHNTMPPFGVATKIIKL